MRSVATGRILISGGVTLVGIVIVSHSQKLAEGVKELAEMMANDVHIEAAGGLDEGLLGTSFERVKVAIEDVCGTEVARRAESARDMEKIGKA